MRTSPAFRSFAALALTFALSTLLALPAQAAAAPWTFSWGPYYAPARHAEAAGTITVTPAAISPWQIPYADKVQIGGTFRDLTTPAATVVDTCGWVVFRITHNSFTGHKYNYTCTFLTPGKITFSVERVRQVEVQVCAEAPTTPPRCVREGTWHTIYVAR